MKCTAIVTMLEILQKKKRIANLHALELDLVWAEDEFLGTVGCCDAGCAYLARCEAGGGSGSESSDDSDYTVRKPASSLVAAKDVTVAKKKNGFSVPVEHLNVKGNNVECAAPTTAYHPDSDDSDHTVCKPSLSVVATSESSVAKDKVDFSVPIEHFNVKGNNVECASSTPAYRTTDSDDSDHTVCKPSFSVVATNDASVVKEKEKKSVPVENLNVLGNNVECAAPTPAYHPDSDDSDHTVCKPSLSVVATNESSVAKEKVDFSVPIEHFNVLGNTVQCVSPTPAYRTTDSDDSDHTVPKPASSVDDATVAMEKNNASVVTREHFNELGSNVSECASPTTAYRPDTDDSDHTVPKPASSVDDATVAKKKKGFSVTMEHLNDLVGSIECVPPTPPYCPDSPVLPYQFGFSSQMLTSNLSDHSDRDILCDENILNVLDKTLSLDCFESFNSESDDDTNEPSKVSCLGSRTQKPRKKIKFETSEFDIAASSFDPVEEADVESDDDVIIIDKEVASAILPCLGAPIQNPGSSRWGKKIKIEDSEWDEAAAFNLDEETDIESDDVICIGNEVESAIVPCLQSSTSRMRKRVKIEKDSGSTLDDSDLNLFSELDDSFRDPDFKVGKNNQTSSDSDFEELENECCTKKASAPKSKQKLSTSICMKSSPEAAGPSSGHRRPDKTTSSSSRYSKQSPSLPRKSAKPTGPDAGKKFVKQKVKPKFSTPEAAGSSSGHKTTSSPSSLHDRSPSPSPIRKSSKPTDTDAGNESDDESRKLVQLPENEMLRDVHVPEIFIRRVLKSYSPPRPGLKRKKHNRVINSYHACLYCGKMRIHMQDHLLRHHSLEPDVERMKNMLPKNTERTTDPVGWKAKLDSAMPFMDLLRASGDHKHNKKVSQERKGEFLLFRRPTDAFDHRDYGPCPKCLCWLRKNSLSKHQKTCPGHKVKEDETRVLKKRELTLASNILLGNITLHASSLLKKEVLTSITDDEIGRLAKEDRLILGLGDTWLKNCYSNELKRKRYASGHMRLMARLLRDAREIAKDTDVPGKESDKLELWDIMRPAYFDVIVKSAISISLPSIDDDEELRSPSNAIKIKYDLVRVAHTKKLVASMEYDKDRTNEFWQHQKDEAKEILDNISEKWTEKVTKQARKILNARQLNRVRHLPKPEDIAKLCNHVKLKLEEADYSKELVTWDRFRSIVQLAQARLMLYNKRRSGELEGILLGSYLKRRPIEDIDSSLMGELSETEQYLLKNQDLVETKGKQDRPVPVLIPKDCWNALKFLSDPSVRKAAGIKEANKYLFPNLEYAVLSSYTSLKTMCSECSLEAPDRITSVAMRKYMATLAQVINLSSNELDWVCRHLGHNKTVHLEHYRQTSPLLERVKVGKLLVMQDLNVQAHYAGKSLQDVDFTDMINLASGAHDGEFLPQPSISQQDESPVMHQQRSEGQKKNDGLDGSDADNDDGAFPEDDQENTDPNEHGIQAQNGADCVSEAFFPQIKKRKLAEEKKRKGASGIVRQPWSKTELAELNKYLKVSFREKITPGREACKAAIKLSKQDGGELWKRHWSKIVKKVSNLLHPVSRRK